MGALLRPPIKLRTPLGFLAPAPRDCQQNSAALNEMVMVIGDGKRGHAIDDQRQARRWSQQ
jgi:hypothetical protein